VIAGKCVTVGRHPVLRISERSRKIDRAVACGAIDASLEGVAATGAKILRQTPAGAAAGQRETEHRIGREVIIEAGSNDERARAEIMAAEAR
jgi:hypothetical protein